MLCKETNRLCCIVICYCDLKLKWIDIMSTLIMKSLTMFLGDLHILHHYEINIAHLLAF